MHGNHASCLSPHAAQTFCHRRWCSTWHIPGVSAHGGSTIHGACRRRRQAWCEWNALKAAIAQHKTSLICLVVKGLARSLLNVKKLRNNAWLLKALANKQQHCRHASYLVPEECNTSDSELANLTWTGFHTHRKNSATKIGDVFHVHFTKVSEVMFPHKELGGLTHSLKILSIEWEVVLIATVLATETGIKSCRRTHGCKNPNINW
mmetsp:Transcript_24985/g.48769  ORF Transcript_24985/g.48769 Transcript_24985/m.48769 type:complete len:206 (-) Transcript_24985:452-1069(-)